ncbi:GNAT family N-acetyltransferase [bacterium]|nr:GNAT family N-acetyltransferase [bacterium]
MAGPLLITSESFEQLQDEWPALHAATSGASPFTHPAFVAAWLRHFTPAYPPVFLGIRDEERLVGVATLEPGPAVARQLGDPNVCDYSGPIALPGYEEEAAAGIIEWLMEDLTVGLDLWGIREDSPMRAALAAGAARFSWPVTEEREAVCPYMDLPGDFETYIASLPKHDRHELRRKIRNLEAAGEVRFDSVTEPEGVRAGMDRFLELMRISRDDKDSFLTPAMEAFFRDLAPSMAAAGMARLSTLWLDGQSVAMLLSFEDADTVYLYNSGFDPAASHLAVGLLSKAYAIEDAIAHGKRRFDFLRGEEVYKRHLGGVPREVLRVYAGKRDG